MSDPDKIYRSVDGNNYVTYREDNFYGSDVEYIKSEIAKEKRKSILLQIESVVNKLYPGIKVCDIRESLMKIIRKNKD